MRLLFDENLSPRLVPRLIELFPGSVHVRDVELKQSPDSAIWDYARQHGYAIITADDDFRRRALSSTDHSPQVVLIERCDFPFATIESLLRRQAIRISDFAVSGRRVLILRRE